MTTNEAGESKFILGFILVIALLFLAGASLTRSLLAWISRPISRGSQPSQVVSPSPVTNSTASPTPSLSISSPSVSPGNLPSISPSASPQSYQARINQPIPVTVRQSPKADASEIGTIQFNQEVTILEVSSDGTWSRVRAGTLEGWIKSSYAQRIN
jgi:hypothetical protein